MLVCPPACCAWAGAAAPDGYPPMHLSELKALHVSALITMGEGIEVPPGSESDRPYSKFMAIYAAMCRWHMRTYGTTQRQIAAVCAKNHGHSARNPYSQFRKTFTVDEILALAAEREKLAATDILSPKIPVVNNIDVAVESDVARIRDALYRQAFGPVRWVECVRAIQARGIDTLVECGPGKVLAGLCKRIDAGLTGAPLYDPATLAEVKGLLS